MWPRTASGDGAHLERASPESIQCRLPIRLRNVAVQRLALVHYLRHINASKATPRGGGEAAGSAVSPTEWAEQGPRHHPPREHPGDG